MKTPSGNEWVLSLSRLLLYAHSLSHTCTGTNPWQGYEPILSFTLLWMIQRALLIIYRCQTLRNKSTCSCLYMTVCMSVCVLVSGCYVPSSTLPSTAESVSPHLNSVQIVSLYTKQIQVTRANSVFTSSSVCKVKQKKPTWVTYKGQVHTAALQPLILCLWKICLTPSMALCLCFILLYHIYEANWTFLSQL